MGWSGGGICPAGLLLFLALLCFPGLANAQAIPVQLTEDANGGWQLLRGGLPYFIQGAGGSHDKAMLAAAGANSFRTWAIGPELGEELDEAARLGLTVVAGHWLGHERHGFDYSDFESVAEQFERVRRDVLAYKDHPALLMWGIGNETEGFGGADNAAVWSHIEALAAMVKRLDPNHPTMAITADIGGNRVDGMHRLCPSIDIMGINSYGGLTSIPERYRKAGGKKPIVITEFGPPGVWEIEKTAFGAPPELTSTQKAAVYRDAYERGCLEAEGLCLGGFVFTWGYKMEATSTWFGMFLPSGDKLGVVDTMTEIWSGAPAANLCPVVNAFGLEGSDVVAPGDTVRVRLDIEDPEGEAIEVHWELRGEATSYFTGGDYQATPLALDGVIQESSERGATLIMPGGGLYRLYMTASDGQGGGATANVPVLVDGEPAPLRIKLPLYLYGDGHPEPWAPSGWMGGRDALKMDPHSIEEPHSGESALRFDYSDPGHWVGVVWQHPAEDWGEKPGGFELGGAEKLTFWARGSEGGEKLSFGVGIVGEDKPFPDTAFAKIEDVKLKKEWKRYSIKLKGKDLSRVKSGFWWTLKGQGRPITFWLDDIRFE